MLAGPCAGSRSRQDEIKRPGWVVDGPLEARSREVGRCKVTTRQSSEVYLDTANRKQIGVGGDGKESLLLRM